MILQDWRTEKGWTQQQFAEALNELARTKGAAEDVTSQSAVNRWEHGSVPRQENIRLVAELTADAVSFSDFYGDAVKPKRKPRDPTVSRAASLKGASSVRRQRQARA